MGSSQEPPRGLWVGVGARSRDESQPNRALILSSDMRVITPGAQVRGPQANRPYGDIPTSRVWDSHRIKSGFVARTYKVAQKMLRGRPPHLYSHFIGACDKTRINAMRIPLGTSPEKWHSCTEGPSRVQYSKQPHAISSQYCA